MFFFFLSGGGGEDEKGKAALKPQLSSEDPMLPPPRGLENQMSAMHVCPADPEPISVNMDPSLNPQGNCSSVDISNVLYVYMYMYFPFLRYIC